MDRYGPLLHSEHPAFHINKKEFPIHEVFIIFTPACDGLEYCYAFPFGFFLHTWINILIGQKINIKNLYNY